MPPEAYQGGKFLALRNELKPDEAPDPQRAGFDGAMIIVLNRAEDSDDPQGLAGFVLRVLDEKPQFKAGHLLTQIRRSANHGLYGRYPGYPEETTTDEAWLDCFDFIFDDPELRKQFEFDVLHRELQSNVSERYKGLKTFAQLARQVGRLTTTHIIDIGTSKGAGMNHIGFGKPFKKPEIVLSRPRSGLLTERHAGAYYYLMNSELQLDLSVGIDLEPHDYSLEWVRACSLEPAELLDAEQVALFDQLTMRDHPNFHYYQADYANFDHDAFAAAFPGQKFDIVHASTSLYQADDEAREVMLQNARMQAGKFVVVQDFVEVVESGRELYFREDWNNKKDFPYRTVFLDVEQAEPRWQEIFRWTDGRVRKLDIGLGKIATSLGKTRSVYRILDRMVRQAG